MGRARWTAIGSISLTIAVLACACELLVDTSGLDDPKPAAPEAGSDAAVIADAAAEASMEAGIDACAPTLAPLVPFEGVWTPRGDAKTDGTKAVLTSGPSLSAIWRSEAVMLEAFDMTAGYEIVDPDGDGTIADGLAFAWVAGQAIPDVGRGGSGLGVQGLQGFAVAIDTFTENETPPVVIVINTFTNSDANEWRLTKATPPAGTSVLGVEHLLRVRLEKGGIVTVWLDGLVTIDRFTIPGYTPYQGHWGFTGATGQITSTQRITRVAFVTSSQACP